MSPDGKSIYCTHIYPNAGAFRTQPNSEITVIDTERRPWSSASRCTTWPAVFHVALSADGKLGVAAQLRPKNLIPLAHVEHGWAFGDSLTLFGEDVGGTVQIPIDELDRYYALPWGVAITPDKSKIFLTTAGSQSVTVIDVPQLLKTVRRARQPFVNDLSASADYVSREFPLATIRAVLCSRQTASVSTLPTVSTTTSLSSIRRADKVVSTIDLGGPKNVDALRRGERLFYTADFAFQGQFGCANCHLDATIDGLQWDLEPDGFGKDIVDNRSLENLAGTEPFKWNGGNADMPTECGPRTEKFFFRSQSFTQQQLTDLVTFVYSLPYRPNRYRSANGELDAGPGARQGDLRADEVQKRQPDPECESMRLLPQRAEVYQPETDRRRHPARQRIARQ